MRSPRLTDSPALCELLDRPVPVVVTTIGSRGRPQSSVVWAERREDELVMSFVLGSAKVRNLERNQLVVIVVADYDNPMRAGIPPYAQIVGTACSGPEEPSHLDRLARRYGWSEGYDLPHADFTTYHVAVERIAGFGPFEDGEMAGWLPPKEKPPGVLTRRG